MLRLDLERLVLIVICLLWRVERGQNDAFYSRIKMCAGFKSCVVGGHSTPEFNYKTLKNTLGSGCTHVQGNVIIQGLEKIKGVDPDLSFLDTIQEITGCLIVSSNTVPNISLKNLKIIRGHQYFERKLSTSGPVTYWAVYVTDNHKIERSASGTKYPPGLKNLDLRSLKSIQNYGVIFESNLHLCYPLYTVNWHDIFEEPSKQEIKIEQDRKSISKFCSINDSCSSACKPFNGKRYCWGRGADMCQVMSKCRKRSCSYSNRCFEKKNTKEEECCHPQCVAGCRGGTARDCLACREFLNDGECVRSCPASKIYDKQNYEYKPNPNRRLAWGPFCVLRCTEGYYEHEDSCVASCDKTSFIPKGNKCVPCNDLCPKKCRISQLIKTEKEKNPKMLTEISYTTRTVLKLLHNCTIVNGDINIISLSRNDPYHSKYKEQESVRPQDLWHLKNIKEFDGRLTLDLKEFPEVSNISFLENLEDMKGLSFSLTNSKATFLGLRRLKKVSARRFIIVKNLELCYTENFEKSIEFKSTSKNLVKYNRPLRMCIAEGKKCDPACKQETGCRGPGRYLCGSCALLKAGDACVSNCTHARGYHFGSKTKQTKECAKCHPECKLSCKGPGPADCVGGCKHFKDGPNCVKTCPKESKFANKATGLCEDCHPACQSLNFGKSSATCTGKDPYPGPNGCVFCEYVLMKPKSKQVEKCVTGCPSGTYKGLLVKNEIDPRIAKYVQEDITKTCRVCHPECATCYSPNNYGCPLCKHFRYRDTCVSKCPPEDTYSTVILSGAGARPPGPARAGSGAAKSYAKAGSQQCLPCHDLCRRGCHGPTQRDCRLCKKVKVYEDDKKVKFLCNQTCPPHLPYEENEVSTGDTVCVVKTESLLAKESRQRTMIVATVVPATIIVIIISIIIICCVLRTREVARRERMRLKAKYTGALRDEENIPLNAGTLTHGAPNQSLLRIINSKELLRGNVIGSGAFGTVYRGKWYPPREKEDTQQVFIDVAVKLLSDVSDPVLSAEFLEEARVMATVQNPHVMALLGVCMTAQLQLVSRYMPHGSLLEYVRRRHALVKSKALITWALQIAKGMEYLESKKIIHRDLAARNVLVQEENHVRITDFGLAKLVDTPDGFQSSGGKMPVKWLALECIRHRRFSHRSDVWAYGITLWELFTFGQRPYENLNALQMCEYLERGERLQQPEICTLDVYMLMIKCWMPDEDSRPSFHEIVEEMTKMSADPARYLVIQNDSARQAPSSLSSNSGGGYSHPRSQQTSHNSDEDKSLAVGGGCSDAYVPHTCPSSADGDGGLRAGPSNSQCCADDRHRHLAAAARRGDRKAAAARYAVDPLSSSSPPASSSTVDDDYLEPHHSSPATSPYVNTGPATSQHDPLIVQTSDNPEYFGPQSPEVGSPYYNEDVFPSKSSDDSHVPSAKYANWSSPTSGIEDTSV